MNEKVSVPTDRDVISDNGLVPEGDMPNVSVPTDRDVISDSSLFKEL